MSDRAAFLAHIADHPDADLPRLVFADWLEERGDPLGEFIRVQIELSHRQHQLGDPDTRALLTREDELLTGHREVWADGWNLTFDRGLPTKLRMDWREFADSGGALLSAWPTIRTVSLRDAYLLRQPVHEAPLDRVRELHLEGWPDDTFAESVVDHPHWNPAATFRANIHLLRSCAFEVEWDRRADTVRRVEFVQAAPAPPLRRNSTDIDAGLLESVCGLNARVGREMAVLIRPYERLYPLFGEIGGGFFAGHLRSGAAALFGIAPQGRRLAFCTFTDEGRVDKALWEDTTEPPWTLDRIRERFGFELGFIRVRGFRANNMLSVSFWWAEAEGEVREFLFDDDAAGRYAEHLADPREFFVGFDSREVRVAYRTARGKV